MQRSHIKNRCTVQSQNFIRYNTEYMLRAKYIPGVNQRKKVIL